MVASTVTYPHEVVRSHMHIAGSGPFKGFLKTCKQVSPHPVDSQAPDAFHPPGSHPSPTAHVFRRPSLAAQTLSWAAGQERLGACACFRGGPKGAGSAEGATYFGQVGSGQQIRAWQVWGA